METHGFTVNRRKFISVKAPEQQRAVRLQNLGNGYSEPELMTRIKTYSDRETYAQKFDRLVRERLSEQEQEKVKRSQSQKITIYKPNAGTFGRSLPLFDSRVHHALYRAQAR